MKTTKLAIVVPCYNEEEVLNETTNQLSSLLTTLEKEEKISEGCIMYVDDGSNDKTWSLIEHLSTTNFYIKGLKLAHNVGHQHALWAGLEWGATSQFNAIVSIDADLQDDVQAISTMIDYFNEGNDIIYGVRKERNTDTLFKKHTAQCFYKLMQAMGGNIIYNHADFRLMSKRALQALVSHPERNLFLRGMVRNLGYPSAFVYYNRHERFAGESKYPFSKMLNFAIDGITSFSIKPLRLITTLGLLFILIAIGIIGYALFMYFTDHTIQGWTSLLISIWFVGGALLTAIGVIGEYLGKIYKEVKRRPHYFIEKELNIMKHEKSNN